MNVKTILRAGLVSILIGAAGPAQAALGNCWHYPYNVEPGAVTMRNPTNPIGTSATYVYVGNYQPTADMTGGWVFYKKSTAGTWSSNSLAYDSTAGNNNYWKTAIPSNTVDAGETLQYYVQVNYANGGADTTFLGTTNQTGQVQYAQATNAAAHPYEAARTAVPGNCWHFPTNVEPGTVTMRNPTNPTPGADTYIYVGNYQPAADMTGGKVFFKKSTAGSWSTNSLAHDSTAGDNSYWKTALPSNAVALGETLQYYIEVDYANGGADTTYLGTTNQTGQVKYAQATNAAAHPFAAVSTASLGNCWHIPTNAEPAGAYMRNPRHPYASNTVTIYTGNQAYGDGTPGNQTGGTLYYRLSGGGGWSTAALAFDSEVGNNKYWKSAIAAGTFVKTQTVEYVLAITFTDRDTTYLGATEEGTTSQPFATLAEAQAQPLAFTYGDEPGLEPGFIWHGSNVVKVASNTIEIWAKIGYEATNGYRWADHAEVRYRITTNGASRRAVSGVSRLGKLSARKVGAGDLVLTNAMVLSHTEDDPSENGNTMWWVATIQDAALTNLDTLVQYQVAAWNSATNGGNGVVRKAEYQTDGAADEIFEYRMYTGGSGALTVNGQNADYTTTKFFIDEAASNTAAITVVYSPPAGATSVELFSNVGRRDMVTNDWNADGIEDGIRPPDGNGITTNDTTAYFTAFPMTWNGSAYTWTTNVGKCGAYRLTARYHAVSQTGTNWTWYNSEGRRDHAVVISPKKVLQQTMYELNTLTAKASNNTESGRSTFDELIDPQHPANINTFNEFSIEYLDKLQANCLWFQPIHPAGYDRSENDPDTGSRYNPGSPYATRDYFAVNHFFSRAGTEEAALTEFTNFVAHCDRGRDRLGSTNHVGTINIMLDGVFNHTSWDAEFGQMGVDLGFCTNKNDRIGWFKPGWYSYWQDYGAPATYYHTAWSNDIATAPDRGDFGKWADVAELYYGKYSCLVRHNPDNNSDYLNEQDVYDFAGMSQDTIDLWRYIGKYPEYWLQQTGNSLTNRPGQVDGNGIAYDDYGIDGLRCDFGQGLPPQLWEYIINRTRNFKWNFMFMAETLDGGVPGYRSNRHFDILNENMVFQFTQAHVSDPAGLRTQLENRRTAYNGGAILLNLTGHDEVLPWSDPWVTASRYAMVSAVAGVPMVFYGQEQGIGPFQGSADQWTGFTNFELNFGKNIPHFKKWNKLRVWDEPPLPTSRDMAQWHGRVNWARLNSPALQSSNQYFLSRTAGGDNTKIFAVAKYEAAGAVAAGKDAVLAFALFVNAGSSGHSGASDTYSLQGCWSLLGLSNSASAYYNVRNLAASDANATLWETPKSGAELYANGIYVDFDSDDAGNIYDDGHIVQYLKLEEAESPVATVYLDNLAQTYSGAARIVTATTMPAGLTVSLTYAGNAWAPTNAGSYAVTGTVVAAEYTGSTNGTLIVSKVGLTATADTQSKPYGATNPPLTFQYSGFVNGEGVAALTAAPTAATTVGLATAPGVYAGAITLSGGSAANYSFSYVAGNFTVTEAISSGAVGTNDNNVALTFGPLVNGSNYVLQFRASLLTGDWVNVTNMTGSGQASATLTHTNGATNFGYYRILGITGPSARKWGYARPDKPGNGKLNVVGVPFFTSNQTLNSLMDPLQFSGHYNNAGQADQLMMWNPATTAYVNLALYDLRAFGSQYASNTGWKAVAGFGPGAAYTNPVLPAGSAVWIRGSTTNDRKVAVAGEIVMTGAATNAIVPGLQLIANPFSEQVALSNLAIRVNAEGHYNNAGQADQIMVWDPVAQGYQNLALYDLRSFGAQYDYLTGWKAVAGFGPTSAYVNVTLKPGDGFWFRAVNGSFTWVETNDYKAGLE